MFRNLYPPFAAFLESLASTADSLLPRFAARNFLIDESVLEQKDHLFRVGQVKKPVPPDLGPARSAHLRSLRVLYGRPDYAALTDPESE